MFTICQDILYNTIFLNICILILKRLKFRDIHLYPQCYGADFDPNTDLVIESLCSALFTSQKKIILCLSSTTDRSVAKWCEGFRHTDQFSDIS